MNQRRLGFAQILLSGACFGFLGLFGKLAFKAGLTPGELLSMRYLTAAIMLGLYLVVTGQKPWQLRIPQIMTCLLLGIFGYAVFSFFYFSALKNISASLTVLLLYTYPVMVSLGARVFFKEHLGKPGRIALILCFLGMLGLVWGEWRVNHPINLVFGIGSAFFYACYILVSGKVLTKVPATTSTFYILLGAGLSLSALSFAGFDRPIEILQNQWPLIVVMAFVCSLLAMTLFQAGLQKISSPEASIVSTSEPLFGVLVAILFLNEQIQLLQIIGAILVLSAMIILGMRKTS